MIGRLADWATDPPRVDWPRVKPMVDRLAAAALLIVGWPVIALVALLVWLTDGRPVVFTQRRIGRNERAFVLYKFRTMRSPARGREPEGDSQRVTSLGRRLRRLSLDELPQLINIVRGEMSFVGPRPLPVDYLGFFDRRERRRHDVRPGITGLAQTKGRNLVSWEDRLALDEDYVESVSGWTDLRILLRTVLVVLGRSGAQAVPSEHGARRLDVYRSFPTEGGYRLRPLRAADLPVRVRWLHDPAVAELMSVTGPVTQESTERWFAAHTGSRDKHDFAVEDPAGAVVAMCGFSAAASAPGGASVELYFLVGPEYRRRGIGLRTVRLALRWAFTHRGYAEVTTTVHAANVASLSIHEAVGFDRESDSAAPRHALRLRIDDYRAAADD